MEFAEYLPIWDKLTKAQQDRIAGVVEFRKVKKGTHIHDSSAECLGLVMVRSGQLRAYILSEDGREITIEPMGMVPYYMWNVTGGMYHNAYYGANFVDYVGYVTDKLTMVRPVNGVGYDTFIMGQYFDMVIDGPAAPDQTTLTAIKAIKAIPEKVGYNDADLVEAARAAYTKIATIQQQALVTNYADLISAEQRIIALTPAEEGEVAEGETVEGETESTETEKSEKTGSGVNGGAVALVAVLALLLGGGVTEVVLADKKGYDSVVMAGVNKIGHAILSGCGKGCQSSAVKAVFKSDDG